MDGNLPELDNFMVLQGLRRFSRAVRQTDFHDVQGFTRCQNGLVPRSGMIGMAMRDDGALHREEGIYVEIARFAVEARWLRPQPVFEFLGISHWLNCSRRQLDPGLAVNNCAKLRVDIRCR